MVSGSMPGSAALASIKLASLALPFLALLSFFFAPGVPFASLGFLPEALAGSALALAFTSFADFAGVLAVATGAAAFALVLAGVVAFLAGAAFAGDLAGAVLLEVLPESLADSALALAFVSFADFAGVVFFAVAADVAVFAPVLAGVVAFLAGVAFAGGLAGEDLPDAPVAPALALVFAFAADVEALADLAGGAVLRAAVAVFSVGVAGADVFFAVFPDFS
ncbi:MAG: hypothetical protein LBQ75_01600 [Zoogloeaceae bacterium]|nr:hypothetical protein [Zoogloeaceae bacterium]